MTTSRPLIAHIVPVTIALGLLGLLSQYDFILFHYLVELFSIVIGAMVFVIVWNNRSRLTDAGLVIIGVSYFFVALVDLLHTLSYAGTGLFQQHAPDMPTQFWIAARSIEGVSLALGIVLYGRRSRPYPTMVTYAVVSLVLVYSIYPMRLFPTAYREGSGLTQFKLAAEYTIVAIVLLSGAALLLKRNRFSREAWPWLLAAYATTAISELLFTGYLGVYDLINVAGHLVKTISFYCMYQAFVVLGIREPHRLLFRELQERERDLTVAVKDRDLLLQEVHHRVKNNVQLMLSLVDLEDDGATPEVRARLSDLSNRIRTIEMIHDRLSKSEATTEVDLTEYLSDVARRLTATIAPARTQLDTTGSSVHIAGKQAISVALIVSELLTNVFKHAVYQVESATVRLSIDATDTALEIRISDPGIPYDSEKKLSAQTLGTTIVRTLLEQLHGSLEHSRCDGTNVSVLTIPIATPSGYYP